MSISSIYFYFQIFRKKICELRLFLGDAINDCQQGNRNCDQSKSKSSLDANKFINSRLSVLDFLNFLKRFLHLALRNIKSDSLLFPLCSEVLNELKSLLVFVGRLSQFRSYFWTNREQQQLPFRHNNDHLSPLYNYYHVILEIWWSAIEISYIIQSNIPSYYDFKEMNLLKQENLSTSKIPLFSHAIKILLYDIILLASQHHFGSNDIFRLTSSDYQYQSTFICTCSWEAIIALRFLLTSSNQKSNKGLGSFYDFLFESLSLFSEEVEANKFETIVMETEDVMDVDCIPQDYTNNEDDDEDHFTEIYLHDFNQVNLPNMVINNQTQNQLFQINVLTNIIPLLVIDLDHQQKKLIIDTSNQVTIPLHFRQLLRNIIQGLESNSDWVLSTLLLMVKNCLQFFPKSNLDLLVPIAEYYLQNLNINYELNRVKTSISIQDYSWMPQNSDHWIRLIPTRQTELDVFDSGNHFKLFVSILSTQLGKFSHEDKIQNLNYQKFIGKIVINLQPRLLKNLETIGIFNLGTLLQTIVANISTQRWLTITDKFLFIFRQIEDDFCFQLWIQFHFSILKYDTSSYEIKSKIVKQIETYLPKFLNRLFQISNLKQYYVLLKLYFEELSLLLELMKSWSNDCKVLMLECLFLNLDLSEMFRNIRFTNKQLDIGNCDRKTYQSIIVESINGILNFIISSKTSQPTFFIQKLIEKLKEIFRLELIPYAQLNDMETLSKIAFSITQLNQQQDITTIIKYFLELPDHPVQFQIFYLHHLFEDLSIVTKMKDDTETTNQNETNITSDLAVTLLSTWCRLIPIGIICPQTEMIVSLSNNLMIYLFDIEDPQSFDLSVPVASSVEVKLLNCFRHFLLELRSKWESSTSYSQKYKHYQLMIRFFGPFINDCRSLFTSKSNNQSRQQLTTSYLLISFILHHSANQLYLIGKSDSLLAIIFKNLISNLSGVSLDSIESSQFIIGKCFPLIFEGICQLQIDGDPYLERKIRQLISIQLPFICRSNINIKEIFTKRNVYDKWRSYLWATIEKIYLVQRIPLFPRQVFDYLNQFCSEELIDDFEPSFVMRLSIPNFSLNEFNSKESRFMLMKTIIGCSVKMLNHSHDLSKYVIIYCCNICKLIINIFFLIGNTLTPFCYLSFVVAYKFVQENVLKCFDFFCQRQFIGHVQHYFINYAVNFINYWMILSDVHWLEIIWC